MGRSIENTSRYTSERKVAGIQRARGAASDRKVETVGLKEVQPLTGYFLRGGVTALACRKDYGVCIDETFQLFDLISVSAGVHGLQILLAPEDFVRAVEGVLAAIAREK